MPRVLPRLQFNAAFVTSRPPVLLLRASGCTNQDNSVDKSLCEIRLLRDDTFKVLFAHMCLQLFTRALIILPLQAPILDTRACAHASCSWYKHAMYTRTEKIR